jgi:hypothetical protein
VSCLGLTFRCPALSSPHWRSGDGTLSVLNMRKMEVMKRSDYMDEELLAVAVLKHGTKVHAGRCNVAHGTAPPRPAPPLTCYHLHHLHHLQVVCGTQEGVLAVFNWGEWGDVSDRFPGHPASVDTVVPLTEVCVVCAVATPMLPHACSVPHRTRGWDASIRGGLKGCLLATRLGLP